MQGPGSDFVILNVVKNLVSLADVAFFLQENAARKKGATWVERDEILHYVQNDKVGAWLPVSCTDTTETTRNG